MAIGRIWRGRIIWQNVRFDYQQRVELTRLMPRESSRRSAWARRATLHSQNRCLFHCHAILRRCNGTFAIGRSRPANKSGCAAILARPRVPGRCSRKDERKAEKVGQFWRTPEITWHRSPRYYARKFTPCIKGTCDPFEDREIYGRFGATLHVITKVGSRNESFWIKFPPISGDCDHWNSTILIPIIDRRLNYSWTSWIFVQLSHKNMDNLQRALFCIKIKSRVI